MPEARCEFLSKLLLLRVGRGVHTCALLRQCQHSLSLDGGVDYRLLKVSQKLPTPATFRGFSACSTEFEPCVCFQQNLIAFADSLLTSGTHLF